MKRKWGSFLLLLFVVGNSSALAGDRFMDLVTLGSAATSEPDNKKNHERVKTVLVIGDKATYTLYCNEGWAGCTTPKVNTTYDLVENNFGVYTCEEVALAIPQTSSYRGIYCLTATEPKRG